MRFIPRSLAGQLTVLLTAGLTIAQLASSSLHFTERHDLLSRTITDNLAHTVASITHVLERISKDDREDALRSLDIPRTTVSLEPTWTEALGSPSDEEAALTSVVRQYLAGERPVRVAAKSSAASSAAITGLSTSLPLGLARTRYEIQVELNDGRVLVFEHTLLDELLAWPERLLLYLLIVLGSTITLSIIAVRWLARPLGVLADAASELGRNIRHTPLDETGPLEMQRAAKAFNLMQKRITRFVEDRARILAAVSHDLKTPITRLRIRSEMLDDTDLRRKFQVDLDDMESMVTATLDFMRGTERRENVVPIDVNALLGSLAEDFGDAGKDVRLQGEAKSPCFGQPLALKRCVTNLLDNATRYGGKVEIRVRDEPTSLYISIRDDGPGIPEGELDRVFEPFYRLEGSRGKNSGGTGLGLSIARNIARAHGGDVTLRNLDQGFESAIQLPR